jgi:hypothetical protein
MATAPAIRRQAVTALAGSAADRPRLVISICSPAARRRPISSATLEMASLGIGTQFSHGRVDPAMANSTSVIPQGCGSSWTATRSVTSPVARNRIARSAASRCGNSRSSANRRSSASTSSDVTARSLAPAPNPGRRNAECTGTLLFRRWTLTGSALMIIRNLGRIGVTGVLAAGVLGLAAAPALAADVDLALELGGNTIAADASGKWTMVNLANNGTTTPGTVVIVYDTTGLDAAKVTLGPTSDPSCQTENDVRSCTLDDSSVPAPGGTNELALPLLKADGATGAAGKVTVTVKVEGDAVEADNSRTADVTIGGNGPDLQVRAFDVTWQDENGRFTDDPVPPGEKAPLFPLIINQGDETAYGVRVQARLPEHVSFTDRQYDNCVRSNDGRNLDCELTQFSLQPRASMDGLDPASGMFFTFEVQVSADAPGPAALNGGVVTATAIDGADAARTFAAPPEVPDFVKHLTAEQLAAIDADLTDNTDEFVVFVAEGEDDDTGGGDPGDDDGDDDGQGGGLPITGPGAAGIAGAGLAAVGAGVLMLLSTRRRRGER